MKQWKALAADLLAANGIMQGTSATTISPKNPCAIEQSVLLVYRLYLRGQ